MKIAIIYLLTMDEHRLFVRNVIITLTYIYRYHLIQCLHISHLTNVKRWVAKKHGDS